MKILLVRHADRTRILKDDLEKDDPLSRDGEQQALELAAHMNKSGDIPELILTSRWRHAHQTAEILWSSIDAPATLVPLDALTPHAPLDLLKAGKYVEAISHDLMIFARARPDIQDALAPGKTVAMILHKPRNIQCALQLQGKHPNSYLTYRGGEGKGKWPNFGQAICLTASTWEQFLRGKGTEVLGGGCV
jgi:histidine phosphatase superfamily protein (branch 1)